MSRRAAKVLVATCIWTFYVWITRVWIILHDHAPNHGFGFKAVHIVLAVISCGFGIAVGVIGWRALRRERIEPGLTTSAGNDRRQAGTVEHGAQA
jgi:hypothetical protein